MTDHVLLVTSPEGVSCQLKSHKVCRESIGATGLGDFLYVVFPELRTRLLGDCSGYGQICVGILCLAKSFSFQVNSF